MARPIGACWSVCADLAVPIDLPAVLLDIETEWTWNALLTTLSSYRKCSKRPILGHSAQATSLLPTEGTTRCSRIAHGLGCGSGMACVAELSPRQSGWANLRADTRPQQKRRGSRTISPGTGLDLAARICSLTYSIPSLMLQASGFRHR